MRAQAREAAAVERAGCWDAQRWAIEGPWALVLVNSGVSNFMDALIVDDQVGASVEGSAKVEGKPSVFSQSFSHLSAVIKEIHSSRNAIRGQTPRAEALIISAVH
jgi:hypothetical protein